MIDGRKVFLCGFHHAERYRPLDSGEVGALIGRHYHGFLHISFYGLEDRIVDDDGGIEQLIDHLSGEVDSDGRAIPHPAERRQNERAVYALQKRVKRQANSGEY
jgi:hypothetical protein